MSSKKRYVIGISGASGVNLSLKLMLYLLEKDYYLEIITTSSGYKTFGYETHIKNRTDLKNFFPKKYQENFNIVHEKSIESQTSSGSFLTKGMIIVPCSMASLAAISIGLGDNALRRAADVSLKEKKKLILVPREAPFSSIHLKNMLLLANLGVIILPPIPQWYLLPKSIDELENNIVGKILDILEIEHSFYKEWEP